MIIVISCMGININYTDAQLYGCVLILMIIVVSRMGVY